MININGIELITKVENSRIRSVHQSLGQKGSYVYWGVYTQLQIWEVCRKSRGMTHRMGQVDTGTIRFNVCCGQFITEWYGGNDGIASDKEKSEACLAETIPSPRQY